jgi:D-glycero-D-manno-heptose 1,7-bisphosphate phosphatase
VATVRQAVIFCGGLGTRLKPYTDHLPKPMVPIDDRPFLEYLLGQLAAQGIEEFVLMTGYLGDRIQDYFGDGKKWNWKIIYSAGPIEWDTGRRIWEARDFLDPQFVLLYSDNFTLFSLESLLRFSAEMRTPISLLLALKSNGNIRVSNNGGEIEAYDKTRAQPNLNYVEIGYMIIQRDLVFDELEQLPNFPDISFSDLLNQMVLHRKVSGLVMRGGYQSISDPPRYRLMQEYLRPKRIVLIDRDGVINQKAKPSHYITCWKDFKWIADTIVALKKLSLRGFQFIVITNQAGIDRGLITPEDLDEIHRNLISELAKEGITVLDVLVCPHHWDDHCECRKPSAGMFFDAAKKYHLRLDRCIYIGDDPRDVQAAKNAGCGSIYLSEKSEELNSDHLPSPFIWANKLSAVTDKIGQIYSGWEMPDVY